MPTECQRCDAYPVPDAESNFYRQKGYGLVSVCDDCVSKDTYEKQPLSSIIVEGNYKTATQEAPKLFYSGDIVFYPNAQLNAKAAKKARDIINQARYVREDYNRHTFEQYITNMNPSYLIDPTNALYSLGVNWRATLGDYNRPIPQQYRGEIVNKYDLEEYGDMMKGALRCLETNPYQRRYNYEGAIRYLIAGTYYLSRAFGNDAKSPFVPNGYATRDILRDKAIESDSLTQNDPDFDPEKADRNKDGEISDWERAVGNAVAKGIREHKERKGAETFEAKGYKGISASKIQVLEKYIENGGQALDYHELPYHIQRQLEMGKVHELLYQDVNRWLMDNAPNPHHAMPSWLSAEGGRVRTMSGKPHTPRKLRKDQNIKPEEARMRKQMKADYYEPFSDDFYELTESDEEFWETSGAIGSLWDNPDIVNNWVEMAKNDKSGDLVRVLIQGLAKGQRKLKILERRYRDENIRTFLRRNTLLSKKVMNPETDGDEFGGKNYFITPEGGWGVAWLNEAILALDMEKQHIYDSQMNMYGDMGDGFWDYLGSLDPIRRKFVKDRDKLKNEEMKTTSVDAEEFEAEVHLYDDGEDNYGTGFITSNEEKYRENIISKIQDSPLLDEFEPTEKDIKEGYPTGGDYSTWGKQEKEWLSKKSDAQLKKMLKKAYPYGSLKKVDLDEKVLIINGNRKGLDIMLEAETFEAESPFSSDAFNEGRSAGITMFIPEGDAEDYYSNLDTEYMIFYGLSPEDLAKDIDGNSKRYLQFVAGWDDGWNYATLLHEGVLTDDSDSEGDLEDLDYEMAGEWIYKDFPEGLQEYVASPKELGAEVAVLGGIMALGLGYFAFKDKIGFKGETFRATESCSEDEDCPDGKVCVDGKCLPICVDDGDCASWRECRDDLHPTEKVCGEDKTDSTENPFSDFIKREENQVDEPTEPNATEGDTYSTTTKAIIGVGIVGAIGFGIKVLGGMQDKGDE